LSDSLKKILAKTSVEAGPLLLGWQLIRELPEGKVSGRIVETEAYHQSDPASHSYRGLTKRTESMYKEGGHLYVYFTYGIHYCLNIVTGKKGVGEAVLIRAIEPVEGIDIMKRNRNTQNLQMLTNGPGKLAQAMQINNTQMSGQLLGKKTIYLLPPTKKIDDEIMASPRIGISQATDVHWRFYLRDSSYVSK
jgi:DNA-3-methyladenine glycosylase